MRTGSRPKTAIAVTMALSCLAAVFAIAPAGAATQKPTKLLGPVLTRDETSTVSISRDGGVSVALPGGKALWIYGDTPRHVFSKGRWKVANFVTGSSASIGAYTRGKVPKPMRQIWVGHKRTPKLPARFIPAPTNLYMPDGSGRRCTPANGGAEEVRWVTGGALMPNPTYVLITYVSVCVTSVPKFVTQGYGFMIYNWRTNNITVRPVDVYKPPTNGAALPTSKMFGSPIIANGNVTLFSSTCCSPGRVYTVTMPATAAALTNPANYVLHASGASTSFYLTVTGKTPTQPHIQLFELTNNKGGFRVFTAPNANGPWTRRGTGVLPGCKTSPQPCYAMATHPEISGTAQLMVSYYLPGYGPGVKGHPYPHPPMNHLVMASIPYAS